MFTVAYVVVDNEKLFFYNEMMKSLISLRMHNPNQKVCVFTDNHTFNMLTENNAEIFNMAEVISVTIGDDYSKTEKSRFLKLTVRERLSGSVLYIDTDTVICDSFPEINIDASVGMVLEFHSKRNEANWYLTDRYDALSGLDLEGFDYFYNGGVVYSKDDEHAHRFYRKWYELWEQTRKRGTPRDQSPLNYVVKEEFDYIESLDGTWNCQFARAFSMGINYISNAIIIHYFNVPRSAYKFCQEEYRSLPYNDEVILKMLENPKSQFSKCRLVKLDKDNQIDGCNIQEIYSITDTKQFRLLTWIYRHKILNAFFEKCLGFIFRIKDLRLRK